MKYSEVYALMEQGEGAVRAAWPEKNIFVFVRPADSLPVDMVVNKVKSVPQVVKDYYEAHHSHTEKEKAEGKDLVFFSGYVCFKTSDDVIFNGFQLSPEDLKAEDWEVFDLDKCLKPADKND